MGRVVTKALIRNFADVVRADDGSIGPDEIRQVEIDALVDTGATSLVLPRDIVDTLGLKQLRTTTVVYADERRETLPVAGVAVVRVGNRETECDCIVAKTGTQPLIGQIVLEGLDLSVDCKDGVLKPRPDSVDLPLMELR
jgi:clan AA aspartic protease